MKFVRVNDKLINLSNVATIEEGYAEYGEGEREIRVYFIGQEWPLRIKDDGLGTYEEVKAWIRICPPLTRDTSFHEFMSTSEAY